LQHVIEKVWTLVNDLFRFKDGEAPTKETRHLTFGLLIALCQSPLDKSGAMRAKLFTFVKAHDNPQDILPRFNLLQSLTDNGKDLSYFEERIGPLLHDWMADRQIRNIPVAQFMSFLVNVIKFNYTFLDHDILNEIIR
jgi:tuberous sclerosis protein 2